MKIEKNDKTHQKRSTDDNEKIPEITVHELEKKIKQQDAFKLIDVRQPEEYQFCKIDSAQLIPLSDLEKQLINLDKRKSYVMMCKSGGRSAEAVKMMKEKGFQDVRNLRGGIIQWALDIDPALPTY